MLAEPTIERAVRLLAQSDQWATFVGTSVAKTVDEMLKDGDLVAARMHLEQTLSYYLSKVAAEARGEHLRGHLGRVGKNAFAHPPTGNLGE